MANTALIICLAGRFLLSLNSSKAAIPGVYWPGKTVNLVCTSMMAARFLQQSTIACWLLVQAGFGCFSPKVGNCSICGHIRSIRSFMKPYRKGLWTNVGEVEKQWSKKMENGELLTTVVVDRFCLQFTMKLIPFVTVVR